MDPSSDERFDIFFAGECLPGHREEEVRSALQNLFRIDAAALERLFSGDRRVIRRDCDRATALDYQRAMKQAGARPVITRATAGDARGVDTVQAADATQVAAPPLTLADAGSDVLRPEERQPPVVVTVDTSGYAIAEPGERLAPATPAVPDAEVPDYALAEPGSRLSEPAADTAPAPDTGHLSLADGDFDLSDCAPPPAPPLPLDLDHLVLAEPGADLQISREPADTLTGTPDAADLEPQPRDDPPA